MKFNPSYKIVKEKRFRVFMLSLLIAFIAWSIINLSKEYTKTIAVELLAINIPKDALIKNESTTLAVEVKGSGLSLLKNQLKGLKYQVDMERFPEYWKWNYNERQFKSLLPSQLTIVNVIPESVYFNKVKLAQKKVKVVADISVKPQAGFDVSEIEVKPKEITIYGAASVINELDSVYTEKASFVNVKAPVYGKLALSNDLKLKYTTDSIQYNYTVERFTQGEFTIPIVVKNAPIGKEVTIFPKQITLQFQSPLSKFSAYNSNQFQVYVDAGKLTGTKRLKIQVAHTPKGIKNIRLLKNSVTYLLIDK